MSAWIQMEAERAFAAANRSRRRASLVCRLHGNAHCSQLRVHDVGLPRPAGNATGRGVREIPLEKITGTTEPNRAAQFDYDFRPAPPARRRWQRLWMAEQQGAVLPPISVVPVGDAYAIRDGHHRVSVARARGALTIMAIVAAS